MTEAPSQTTLEWKPIANLEELRGLGVLHEVNRILLHPIGLALGIKHEEGKDTQLILYDGRDDPEGIIFADNVLDGAKAMAFATLMKDGVERRMPSLGYGIQPVEAPIQVLLSLRELFEGHGPSAEDAEAQVRYAAGVARVGDAVGLADASSMTGHVDLDSDGGA